MKVGCYYRNREEAAISGGTGCGVIYLAGCSLRCVYCLVHEISWEEKGTPYSPQELAALLLRMEGEGVSHIELANVEPSAGEVIEAIRLAREQGLTVPLINNFSGYAGETLLQRLMPWFEGYLMDVKYADAVLGNRLSGVPDYPERVREALCLLSRHYGENRYTGEGLLRRGVLLRHLMLPGLPENTDAVLRFLAEENPMGYPLDLMDDFVPEHRTAEFLEGPYLIKPALYQEKKALALSLGLKLIE